ncbi:MAG: hypothetical protein ACLUKN_10885 [Bacilli bacterium]
MAENVDVVIHATPVFRPLHLRAIVEAGKHMFVESLHALMVRRATYGNYRLGRQKGPQHNSLAYSAVSIWVPRNCKARQRRADWRIVSAQAYWLNSRFWIQNGGNLYLQNKDPMSMEYQIRNWFIFRWASGDCYVEQHVHNLDVISWVMGKDPKEVNGVGGRRFDLQYPDLGDRFSHFAVDFDFGDGVHCASYSRREPKSKDYVLERVVGTKGIMETHLDGGIQRIIGSK